MAGCKLRLHVGEFPGRSHCRVFHATATAGTLAAYPQCWIGKIAVQATDGRLLHGRVDEPKGDPGSTLSRAEITAKARWQVAQWPRVGKLLAADASAEQASPGLLLLQQAPHHLAAAALG